MKLTEEIKQALKAATNKELHHYERQSAEAYVQCMAVTWLSKILEEREKMAIVLRDIAGSCFAADEPSNIHLWGRHNTFIQNSRAILKQVGEIE